MRVRSVEFRREDVPLSIPYALARGDYDAATFFPVVLTGENGLTGLGSASPAPEVTGETAEACEAALNEAAGLLAGADAGRPGEWLAAINRAFPAAPAARAALDMAMHDLLARHLGVPLVEFLGRAHETLPTSITIGILPVEEAAERAREHVASGFRALKVKLGRDPDEDIARLRRIRETVGDAVAIRADANAGYDSAQLARLLPAAAPLGIEFIEQPLPRGEDESLDGLPAGARRRLAADESLLDEADAWRLACSGPGGSGPGGSGPGGSGPGRSGSGVSREFRARYGIFSVKLMKCGGIAAARRIATIAECAGVELMWSCMDESVIGIAAALHAAFSSPATRYLDLDGHLDLSRDFATGGFVIRDGMMRIAGGPGLGVSRLDRESGTEPESR